MADRLVRLIGLVGMLLALSGCGQTPTKPDTKPVDLAEIYALAAKAYEQQDWPASEKHYITLTQKLPEEVEPWFKLGNIYARTLRLDGAIKFYREALVRDSEHVKAWHNMAVVQLREASKSFAELEVLVQPEDELHKKSVKIQKTIDELVN